MSSQRGISISSEFAVFSQLDRVINWSRLNSLNYLTLDLACCGVEMSQVEGPRYDIQRFGAMPVCSAMQADLLFVSGTVTYKMANFIKKKYDEMGFPKYVVAIGSCASTGSPFHWEASYSSVSGVDKIIPVDVYIPGCPPRPEAILHGLLKLQTKIESSRGLSQGTLESNVQLK